MDSRNDGIESNVIPWPRRAHCSIQAHAGRRTVLIVDDDKDNLDMLALLLQLAGHDVHVATRAEQAIEAANRHAPELIFLDIVLPNVDGYALCRRLRQISLCRDSAIYALSGLGGTSHASRCREAGFTGQLLKPVDPVDLVRLVNSR